VEICELSFLFRKQDAIFKAGTGGKLAAFVAEGIEQVDEKKLRLALFVAFELDGVIGKILKGLFLLGHARSLQQAGAGDKHGNFLTPHPGPLLAGRGEGELFLWDDSPG
jgi:hypothetical protein